MVWGRDASELDWPTGSCGQWRSISLEGDLEGGKGTVDETVFDRGAELAGSFLHPEQRGRFEARGGARCGDAAAGAFPAGPGAVEGWAAVAAGGGEVRGAGGGPGEGGIFRDAGDAAGRVSDPAALAPESGADHGDIGDVSPWDGGAF